MRSTSMLDARVEHAKSELAHPLSMDRVTVIHLLSTDMTSWLDRASAVHQEYGVSGVVKRGSVYVRRTAVDRARDLILPKTGLHAQRNRFEDLSANLDVSDPVILYGGAHHGRDISAVLKTFPECRVVGVEANPEIIEGLRDRFSSMPRVNINHAALGPTNESVTLNVTSRDTSSSIRSPTKANKAAFGDDVTTTETVTVPQRRIDTLIGEAPDAVLLDIQGYEYQALRGASDLLSDVQVLLVEVAFREMYENQETFPQICQYVSGHGLDLFNIYELYTAETGELSEGYAMFVQ